MNKRIKKAIIIFSVLVVLISMAIITIEIGRNLNYIQLDDLHPLINCEEKYIEKSDVLMIIPLWKNDSIVNYPEWCKKISESNKTLGMHGIYHTYDEFLGNISEEKFVFALGEFKKCFGKSPELFEPPQWDISSINRKMVEKYVPVTNNFQGIFHKVYHCEESGNFGYNFLGIRVTNDKVSKS